MYSTFAWGKTDKDAQFTKFNIERNLPGDNDVQFEVLYCGICHTDVHYADPKFPMGKYPLVPGHELAGVVTKVGKKVSDVAVGDQVGVGCISDSCQNCSSCCESEENFCEKGFTMTYNTPIEHGHIKTNTNHTLGGYSGSMTVDRQYIVKVPAGYSLEKTGPILCAGVTMYSPLQHWNCEEGGKRVGIVGIGGLGQMGVRLAKAMGNEVTAISTSPNKEKMAREIGADNFVISSDPESMKTVAKSLDLILNTVSAPHDLTALIGLLARDGTVVQLGVVMPPHAINQMIFFRRVNLSGSLIGGMKATQDCIDFCAAKNIEPATKLITADKIGEVYAKLEAKNDQVLRYVLDIKASK